MSKQGNKTKTVDGKTYVLYAGRWHIKVQRRATMAMLPVLPVHDLLADLTETPEAVRIAARRSHNPSPLWIVNEIAAEISAHVYFIRRAQEAN